MSRKLRLRQKDGFLIKKRVVPNNESREKIKKYEEICSEVRDLIRSITENWDDDDDEKWVTCK